MMKQPWIYRKYAYLAASALLVFFAGKGYITDAQSADLLGQIDQLIGAILLLIAGTKTNAGSDDPTTKSDLDKVKDMVLEKNVGEIVNGLQQLDTHLKKISGRNVSE